MSKLFKGFAVIVMTLGLFATTGETSQVMAAKKQTSCIKQMTSKVKRVVKKTVKKTKRAVVKTGAAVQNAVADTAVKAKAKITGKKPAKTFVKGHYKKGNKTLTNGHFRTVSKKTKSA